MCTEYCQNQNISIVLGRFSSVVKCSIVCIHHGKYENRNSLNENTRKRNTSTKKKL